MCKIEHFENFTFFGSKPVVVEPSAGQLSSDAWLLPIRQFDQRIGLTEQFAQALGDRRRQRSVDHPFLQMVRMRIYGVLADYPDQNDRDRHGRFHSPREFQVSVCHW